MYSQSPLSRLHRALGVFLSLLCIASQGGCHASSDAPTNGDRANTPSPSTLPSTDSKDVTLVTVEQRPWKTVIRSQGGLIADEATVIGTKVAGRVSRVEVDLGDFVQAGDTIALLDQRELELQAAQAEAQLAQARAAVGLAPDASSAAIDRENSPVVRQERAVLQEAQANLSRLKLLQEKNAVTQADLDTIAAAVAVAEARYAASLNSVEEKLATIRVREAELSLAREVLQHTKIVAPFDGLIQARPAASGSYVRVGDPIVTLVRIDPLRYRGTVPERRALNLREGQQVYILLDGFPEPLVTRVSRISPALEEFSRSLVFEADLPNPEGRLRSGLFAEAEVVIDADTEALSVPASSVFEFAGLEKVWIVEEGVAREVVVQTGRRDQGRVEIISGLSEGDTILQRGVEGRPGPVSESIADASAGG